VLLFEDGQTAFIPQLVQLISMAFTSVTGTTTASSEQYFCGCISSFIAGGLPRQTRTTRTGYWQAVSQNVPASLQGCSELAALAGFTCTLATQNTTSKSADQSRRGYGRLGTI
jgi:hypothetical protein